MGIVRKVLTGIGCAASVAGGVIAGKAVGMKVYERTGSTAAAGAAGGGTAAAIGLGGIGATMTICQLSIDSENWRNHCYVEDEIKKQDQIDHDEEIKQLTDLVDDYYSESIKMTHEIDRLQEENQKLKEQFKELLDATQAQAEKLEESATEEFNSKLTKMKNAQSAVAEEFEKKIKELESKEE